MYSPTSPDYIPDYGPSNVLSTDTQPPNPAKQNTIESARYTEYLKEFTSYTKFTKHCKIAYYSAIENTERQGRNVDDIRDVIDVNRKSNPAKRAKTEITNHREYCADCLFVALNGDCVAVIEESQKFLMSGVMVYLQDVDVKLFEKKHRCEIATHLIRVPINENE